VATLSWRARLVNVLITLCGTMLNVMMGIEMTTKILKTAPPEEEKKK
jgi:hypothetical protein